MRTRAAVWPLVPEPPLAKLRAGVMVANVPGVNAPTVAEHVFMVSLALLRRFRQVDGDLPAGFRFQREESHHHFTLPGRGA